MEIALVSQPSDVITPPSLNSIGIWTYEVSRRLAKEHEVTVYGRRGLAAPRRQIGENVKTQYVYVLPRRRVERLGNIIARVHDPKKPGYAKWYYNLEYSLAIALHLRRTEADIVHIQNYSQYVPVIRAFNPNIKIALHMRCDWLALLDYDMIDQRLKQTDLILGVSDDITNAVRTRFPHHAAKCFTAYTGVDTESFKPGEATAKKGRNLLFVGRITPEKGVHVLLEAFKQIAPRFPDLTLTLLGAAVSLSKDRLVGISDTEQIQALEKFYEGADYRTQLDGMLPPELKERVQFTGHVRYNEILSYFHKADILINPALVEPFGRTLIEANACGVPVIAARAGGMVETIEHGKNGLLVEPGDADDLAQAISRLIENDAVRESMGTAGRKLVVDRFSWDRITEKLLAIYESTMFTRKPEGRQRRQERQAHSQ